jgi:steroid delta-isomerase-like uncharacterized protein
VSWAWARNSGPSSKKRYNDGGSSGLASLYANDAVYTDPMGHCEGREAILEYFETADRPFSDISLRTTRLIEERDTVVAEWTWRATNTAPLAMPDGTEIPATRKTVELPGVSVFTVRDGMLASERDYVDIADMMSQLGLTPGT